MKFSRNGMTFFELLVVIIIIGIIYSIGLFTIKKEKIQTAVMDVSTLKTTLLAYSQSKERRLYCDDTCKNCSILSKDGEVLANLHLRSNDKISRYAFNPYGELNRLGNVITTINNTLTQGCFEMTLYPDGTLSPLILEEKNIFYVYTPLGPDKPYVAKSEEALRKFIYDENKYPLSDNDHYGTK